MARQNIWASSTTISVTLATAFGLLVRARDYGVLPLLDNRITNQRYGRVFSDSLPPYRFTAKLEDVEEFFHV